MKKLIAVVVVVMALSACVSQSTHDAVVQDLAACRSELLQCRDTLATDSRRLQTLQRQEQQLRQQLKSQIDAKDVEIARLNDRLSIQVKETLLFKSGSAEILPAGVALLKAVLPVLRDPGHAIQVDGHADNKAIGSKLLGRYASNWELSCGRATRVVRYLQEAGIQPDRLIARCHSYYRSVADNGSSEGRGKNRRVEVSLIAPALVRR